MEAFSDRLKSLREKNNLSHEGLANLAGVKTNDIICWENKFSYPKEEEYRLIENALKKLEALRNPVLDLSISESGFVTKSDSDGITYGQALLNKRRALGMSKKDFASLLNISVYKLAKWEEDLEHPGKDEKEAVNLALQETVDGNAAYNMQILSNRKDRNNTGKSITSKMLFNGEYWYKEGVDFESLSKNFEAEKKNQNADFKTGLIKFIIAVLVLTVAVTSSLIAILILKVRPAVFAVSFLFAIFAVFTFSFTDLPFFSKIYKSDEIEFTASYYKYIYLAFWILLTVSIVFPYIFIRI